MFKFRERKSRDSALAEDLILSCTGNGVSSETAQKAVRALCRRFGGLMVYIPSRKKGGTSAENLRRAIMDAVGEHAAEKIVDKIMALYGSMQIYIPLERCAYKKIMALEIYERNGKNGVTIKELAREYNISGDHAYKLWKKGQREKFISSLPYLPFLELAEKQ